VTNPPDTTPTTPQPQPVPPLQPLWPPPPASDGRSSANWAGFAVGGGPVTVVRGTFNVPTLASSATAGTEVTEWVGIDGANNNSLIQAGIEETYDRATNRVSTSAWWEILPAVATPVDQFQVAPGDQVTVVIWQLSGSTWAIDINDDTNGQHFQTTQTYTGPAASAEWIVEAPTSASGEQETIGAFNPNVIFTNNRFTGTAAVKEMVFMAQRGLTIVIPSPMNARGDFAVAYGGGGAITPP
jgi:hypothetical protein